MNKMVKKIISIIFMLIVCALKVKCQTIIPEAKIKLVLPNAQWPVLQAEVQGEKLLYYSKRKVIVDKTGRNIIPNIGIILEHIPDFVNLKTFNEELQKSLMQELSTGQEALKVIKTYYPSGNEKVLSLKNAIAYKVHYQDENSISHLAYVVYIVNNGVGVQAIFDSTESVFSICDPEFLKTIRSIVRIP